MPTLNRSKPADKVIGACQYPGAVFHQDGKYFDRQYNFVGGDDSKANADDDKDAEIANLKAQLAALLADKNSTADTHESVKAEIDAPAPHGLTDEQYENLVALGVDVKGMDEAQAKGELIDYGELQGVDGLTRNMKVATIATKILEAEGA